jgi:predicted nucleic acid-binding protein
LSYIDTSVLVAYYCPEPLSSQAQKILQQERDLAISSLVELEFASALAQKVRTREIRLTDGQRVLLTFQTHLEQGIFTRLAIERRHFAKVHEWLASFRIALRTLDALHIAVAATEGVSMITSDAELARACAKVGVAARLLA